MTTLPGPGNLFAQRFAIQKQIGSGGMGTVYSAHDQQTGEVVALKLLQSHGDPQEAARFAREAQILAELQHPNIVSYVAHGMAEAGQPYLAMEWLEGEDLAQRLQRGRLSLLDSVALLYGASAALAEAHERNIVHRDLKPSNLFLRGGHPARVAVLDFGIARHLLNVGSLTRTGTVIGTPEYMSPEQARGERDVGPPSDVFSLGCVLYECLTGRPPFEGDHIAAVLIKVLFAEPPPLVALRTGIPEALSNLLARMLCKDPRERFPSGLALHEALRRLELPPEGPPDAAAHTVPALVPLTPQEQQIFSLAVAVPHAVETVLATLTPSQRDEELACQQAVKQQLCDLGVGVELLANGSIVATVFPAASASDQALLAARCGLLLKDRLPEFAVAVATGRGRLYGQMPVGEAVDRALQLLGGGHPDKDTAPQPSNGVWLDDLSDSLLAERCQITHHCGRALLVGEHDPSREAGIRRLLGQPTPCVGREKELIILDTSLATCISDSVARAVGVVAGPGMGKSRLRHEFLRRASQHHPELVVLLGRGDLMNPGSPYGILGQAIRRLCGLVGGEPLAVQQERLHVRLSQHLAPQASGRITCFVGELCGVRFPSAGNPELQAARNDPTVMHSQVTHALLDWLRSECQAAPLLLVLEDLHWGDALTAQLLALALSELSELPLCILALARPAVQELFPAFWNPRRLQELLLRPLSRRASEQLAQQVLQGLLGSAADADTVARIVSQAAGHPLFLEELIRAVAEGQKDTLPETVWAMLVARLSLLDASARQALRAASVFGAVFARSGLAVLLGPGTTSAELDSSLALLVREEFLEKPREGRGLGPAAYQFRHALVRDAAYSLLTEENRVLAHRLACGYLEQVSGTDPAVLAEHASQGQDLHQAARYYLEAATQALARFDLEATLRYVQQALGCGVQQEQLGTVRAIQAWASYFTGELVNANLHAREAVELLPPGSFWWTRAMTGCFFSFVMLGQHHQSERLIPAFLSATPAANASIAYQEAGMALGLFFSFQGLRREAEQLVAKLKLTSSQLEPRDRRFLMMADTWRTQTFEPDPWWAVCTARTALELSSDNGDRRSQLFSCYYLGQAYFAVGAAELGEQFLREAKELATGIRDFYMQAMVSLALCVGLIRQPMGSHREELPSICAAYLQRPEMGPLVRGMVHRLLAQQQLVAEELSQAESAIAVAAECFAAVVPYRLSLAPLQVELSLKQGQITRARGQAEAALRFIEEQGGMGASEVPVRLAVTLARLADGDTEGGRSALRAALAQVWLRADRIAEPALAQSYLTLPENRQLFALAQAHGLK